MDEVDVYLQKVRENSLSKKDKKILSILVEPIDMNALHEKTAHALNRSNFFYNGDLASMTVSEIADIPYTTRHDTQQIRSYFNKIGLNFGEKFPFWRARGRNHLFVLDIKHALEVSSRTQKPTEPVETTSVPKEKNTPSSYMSPRELLMAQRIGRAVGHFSR